MQQRLTAAIAVVAATCILLAHLISLRHETTVAHVRDSVGALAHAHALAEYHAISTAQHLHGNADTNHIDVGCVLHAGLEQSTILAHAPALAVVIAPVAQTLAAPPPLAAAPSSVLRFAPKTSPPALA